MPHDLKQHFHIPQKGALASRFDFGNNPLGRRQTEIQIRWRASHVRADPRVVQAELNQCLKVLITFSGSAETCAAATQADSEGAAHCGHSIHG